MDDIAMRPDRSYSSANRPFAYFKVAVSRNNSRVTYLYTRDVRDRIQWTRRHPADIDTELASTVPALDTGRRGGRLLSQEC